MGNGCKKNIASGGWGILRRTYELQIPDELIAEELSCTPLRVARIRRVALGRISQQWEKEIDCFF